MMGFNQPVSPPLYPRHSLYPIDLDPAPSSASEVAKYFYICFNLPPTSPHPTSHCASQSVPRPLFDESPPALCLLSCLLNVFIFQK